MRIFIFDRLPAIHMKKAYGESSRLVMKHGGIELVVSLLLQTSDVYAYLCGSEKNYFKSLIGDDAEIVYIAESMCSLFDFKPTDIIVAIDFENSDMLYKKLNVTVVHAYEYLDLSL